MEQRRKIIIPTGADGDETLSTPHFDAEATLAARPVVPLADAFGPTPETAYAAAPRGNVDMPRTARTSPSSSPWKRSTLALIILAAVGIGVASGLAIGFYQTSRKTTATATTPATVVAPPSVSEQPQQATVQQPAPPQTTEATEAVQPPEQQVEPEAEASVPDAPIEKEKTASAAAKNRDDDDDARGDDKQAARDNNRRRDEERAAPPAMRDRRVVDPARDERDERDARDEEDARRAERREQRREERRAERRRQREDDDDGPLNVPRRVERAQQEINRIRDIFEGRQP